jgi:predicted RNase H-like HicB family nuclease
MQQATIIYEWSDDGWWVAEVAEVPGAISQGRTQEEARVNVLSALDLLLETRRELALKRVHGTSSVETVALAS